MTTATATSMQAPTTPDRVDVSYSVHRSVGFSYLAGGRAFFLDRQRAGDAWIVRDIPTGIFGQGGTFEDAAEDFGRAVREHLDVLNRQDALSDELARQRDYLRARLG
jgi:hypothetical protein